MKTTPASDDLALKRAQREGLPIVLATPHELLQVATGHTVILGTTDGREVAVKIPTLEEYRATLARSAVWFAEHNLSMPPAPSDAEIRRVIQPLRQP